MLKSGGETLSREQQRPVGYSGLIIRQSQSAPAERKHMYRAEVRRHRIGLRDPERTN